MISYIEENFFVAASACLSLSSAYKASVFSEINSVLSSSELCPDWEAAS